ncbi:MAG: YbaB/EbfC family nucleoid-associated protein [Patescibacteria group bacterium]|jgi:DNA-binding protein YbaB
MFNKLKQFNDLRKQAGVLKNALAGEIVEVENKAVKITMDGNQEIKSLEIKPEFMHTEKKTELEQELKNAFAESIKKVQRKMAMKMQSMGGFDMPGLK